jgi:hypothetical protein
MFIWLFIFLIMPFRCPQSKLNSLIEPVGLDGGFLRSVIVQPNEGSINAVPEVNFTYKSFLNFMSKFVCFCDHSVEY